MQRKLRCLLIEEKTLPQVIEIKNDLSSKQKAVDGYIEYVRLEDDDNVVIICNDEGKINGMGPNRDIGYDIIFGPFLIVAESSNDGEDRSLSDEQITRYMKIFGRESIDKTMTKYEMLKNRNYEL